MKEIRCLIVQMADDDPIELSDQETIPHHRPGRPRGEGSERGERLGGLLDHYHRRAA
jgi:hypothetical protein